jgi:uncharacterized protein YndB with AHSA1/START domain
MATITQNTKELLITRVFDAPRDVIWKAWTEPEFVKRWWGPKGFTCPVSEIDLRVGGKYLSSMRSPEGRDFWSTGVYREIVPLERIVMTDSFADEKGNVVPATHYGMSPDFPLEMVIEVKFEEKQGKTTLSLRHIGIPDGQMHELTEAGWNESFDKLAESLKTKSDLTRIIAEPGKQELVIIRVFDAPRELVFKAYTDPKRIPQWWGPIRFTTTVKKMDVRPGGSWRFVQRDTGGNEYAFHGVYHDVLAPSLIVATFEFEGMPGHVQLETAVFEPLGDKTKLTARFVFQSVEDRDGELDAGMEDGVIETMDRLAQLLEDAKTRKRAA